MILVTVETLVPNCWIPTYVKSGLLKVAYTSHSRSRPYCTNRFKQTLRLSDISREKNSFNTFADTKTKLAYLDQVKLYFENQGKKLFKLQFLYWLYLLATKTQLVKNTQKGFDNFWDLEWCRFWSFYQFRIWK